MEYISKVDNKSFTTKEGLVEHLLKYFSMEVTESDYKEIIDRIQSEHPLVEVESIEKGKKDELIISVSYSNKEGKNLGNERVIVGEVDYYDYYEETTCNNLKDAISCVSSYYRRADDIEKMLKEQFNTDFFSLDEIYSGGHDTNPSIYFSFKINGETFVMCCDFGDTLDQLHNQIKSLFVNKIEGTVENRWDNISNSEVFRIDGVDVRGFLKDGKRVQIEILD